MRFLIPYNLKCYFNMKHIIFQDYHQHIYMRNVILTDIKDMLDDDVLRKINILAMQGIEFMKEGMLRLQA